MLDERAQLLTLLIREVGKTQAKTNGYVLVRDLSVQFEPAAVRKLDAKSEALADTGFAGSVDKAAAFGKVGDPRGTVSVSVPNGLQRNFHSLFSAAFTHIQFWDWEQCSGLD
jgi:hypothetical protein